ncbi:ClpXP protease specificity-enhancing factor SspB [Leptospira sp. 2 VSF19]|uniref:ClpXP protease specificity-enhancing factor SspB n=1 Tax=Leptospira soteropolitanensis TaxID=2950025 RepID=A0AAW5VCH5_9LEPT|nr:ClpXP protease specificity-enhancing factor SspB [Leptospira soteropolitanensis]MCW7492457.1 ClpXP protease specificity-enhancing factor SspB [Leptospira soteropolitanensis]MCW7500508.1 ClpXP protease specificity-enhancing factor SspB [Leptospira soteropolitanensis]MCW7522822.1 ClpXP protease specificity-enhancing factor SspB [Leptospira soteropolitanensis]MCW7526681.1 ClpXP protease specificity-enhancing factor SspB [Leptospira soteropolitanensis]MCW7530478.1 ClpXP protease specificity-enh
MSQNLTQEEITTLREFKRDLFNLYWERFGVFYIHVMPHPKLEIGKRGLLNAEKESGIVLVFGDKAVKVLDSKPDYLFAELQFGSAWEPTVIPWDAVFRIYDKFQNSATQLRFLQVEVAPGVEESNTKPKVTKPEVTGDGNVIRVDFGGKRNE